MVAIRNFTIFLSLVLSVEGRAKVPEGIISSMMSAQSVKRTDSLRNGIFRVNDMQKDRLKIRGGSIGIAGSLSKNTFSLILTKGLLQLGLTCFNILCWILPMKNKNFTQNEIALGVANSFAGGIFLMLAFGHLLPHSTSALNEIGKDGKIAFGFCLVGYLMMFFVEKILFNAHAVLHSVMDGHIHSHEHAYHHNSECSLCDSAEMKNIASISVALVPRTANDEHSHNGNHHSSGVTIAPTKAALSPNSAIILLFAMSVHSLFESMALGIASDHTSALLMSASIALHQPAESIALLVAFLKTGMPQIEIMKWLGFFSLIGPLGATAGMLISKVASPLIDAIIVAITAGTFLYVGATEVVNEEFEDVTGPLKWFKFASFLTGMSTIAGVSKLSEVFGGEHHHGHEHGHHH